MSIELNAYWWSWRQIICVKYKGTHKGDITSKGKQPSSRAPYMSITKNIHWFESNCRWEINNHGDSLSFWHGNWNEKSPLSVSF